MRTSTYQHNDTIIFRLFTFGYAPKKYPIRFNMAIPYYILDNQTKAHQQNHILLVFCYFLIPL